MTVRRLSVLTVASLLAGVGFAAPAHAAATLHCGQTVRSSVTLSADIGPCAGDGLIVKGTGITVNLGGHTIRGKGDPSNDQVGVRVKNSTNVVVTSGTVTEFAAGVALENTSDSTVKGITATKNQSTGAINHGDGIILDGSSNNKVLNNEASDNGPYDGIAMVNVANNNLIKGNIVRDNTMVRAQPAALAQRQDDEGVRLDADASFNTIDNNKILNNGSLGVGASGFPHNNDSITNNIIQGNGLEGIVVPGPTFVMSGNLIVSNGFDQFEAPGQTKATHDGILLFGNFGAGAGVVKNNRVIGNAADGIGLIFPGFSSQGTYHPPFVDTIQGNTVLGNGNNGIFLDCDFLADAFPNHICLTSSPPHQGQQVIGNTAAGNGGVNAGKTAWDLYDANIPPCDDNNWSHNTGIIVNPPCTLAPLAH